MSTSKKGAANRSITTGVFGYLYIGGVVLLPAFVSNEPLIRFSTGSRVEMDGIDLGTACWITRDSILRAAHRVSVEIDFTRPIPIIKDGAETPLWEEMQKRRNSSTFLTTEAFIDKMDKPRAAKGLYKGLVSALAAQAKAA